MPVSEALEADTEVSPDETVSSSDTSQDVEASSSDAEDEAGSMFEAVEAAIETEEGASSDPESEGESPDGTAEDAAQTPPEDPDAFLNKPVTKEEIANYGEGAQKRIKSLLGQLEQAKEAASQLDPIHGFMEENNIPQQDLDVVLNFAAQISNGDFAGFLNSVTPYVNLALQYTGQTLPPDLQQKVDRGYVDRATAQDLARQRAENTVGKQKLERVQQSQHQQQVEANAATIRDTVVNWERQIKQSDPDYALKAEAIKRTSQAFMQEYGPPETPQRALEYVQRAYEEVNNQVSRFRPKPKPVTPSPDSTGQSGNPPVREASSMMEAAQQALDGMRRG